MNINKNPENIATLELERRIHAGRVKLSWLLMKGLAIWASLSALTLFVLDALRSASIMAVWYYSNVDITALRGWRAYLACRWCF